MKKVKDVFGLPVRRGVDDSLVSNDGSYIGDFWTSEMANAAAHAINHVDALVEALELLIQDCGKVHSDSSALGDAELKAKIALANYRSKL